jgi:plasmid stabilization system protein ParE
MRVEYTNRALADLRKISADSRAFGDVVRAALEARIRKVVARIAEHPETAAPVVERPGMASCRSFAIRTRSSLEFSKAA